MSDASPGSTGSQLPLFGPASPTGPARRGIPREVARAFVGPGWWPILAPLWIDEEAIVVTTCRDVGGVLALAAVGYVGPQDVQIRGEPGAGAGEPQPRVQVGDELDLTDLVERVVALCEQTCACCGARPARIRNATVAEPRRVLCDVCAEEIGSGELLLVVADRFWRFDGARRPPILPAAEAREGSPAQSPVTGTPIHRPVQRALEPLPADELRSLVRDIRTAMSTEIVGQETAVGRLALFGALHVGGGLSHGQRALLIGRSGVGKTSIVGALCRALTDAGWPLPCVSVDAIELTSPGWSGAPSMHDLVASAIGEAPYDSPRARHAIVVIDEIHHVGVAPSAELTGNMKAKRAEVLASLLALLGHGSLKIGPQHAEWSAREALVIGLGAFEGLLDTGRMPTVSDLGEAGMPAELATRFHDVVLLHPLGEGSLAELLRRWPAFTSLRDLCQRLGYRVVVHPETIRRVARAVADGEGGATPRTAGGWIVAALQEALLAALEDPEVEVIQLAPDSLRIARSRRGRANGWDDDGSGRVFGTVG